MTRGGPRPGAGRPKGSTLPDDEFKRRITIRLSDKQLDRIKAAAEADRMKHTTFIRMAAINAANNLLDNQ